MYTLSWELIARRMPQTLHSPRSRIKYLPMYSPQKIKKTHNWQNLLPFNACGEYCAAICIVSQVS